MALDWSKQISFSGLARRKAHPKAVYLEKTHMNLLPGDQGSRLSSRNVLTGVLVVILAALVIKFGVFDFYARVGAKQAELNAQKETLATMTAALSEYDEVAAKFESYESANIMSSGLVVNALDALSLVDRCVLPNATVASLTLSEDTLSLKLANTTLDQVGQIVASLEEQDIVANVLLSTAATQQSEASEITATVTVTLQAAADDGKGA